MTQHINGIPFLLTIRRAQHSGVELSHDQAGTKTLTSVHFKLSKVNGHPGYYLLWFVTGDSHLSPHQHSLQSGDWSVRLQSSQQLVSCCQVTILHKD